MSDKISTFLWFNNNAEEAINLYVSLFKNSKILYLSRYPEGGAMPKGTLFTATILLEGRKYNFINGGPHYKLNPSVSLFVSCETQEEIDLYWSKLSEGGQELMCGWLTDAFGLSWQIIPEKLGDYIGNSNPAKAQNAMQAMFKMKKLNIAELQKACDEA